MQEQAKQQSDPKENPYILSNRNLGLILTAFATTGALYLINSEQQSNLSKQEIRVPVKIENKYPPRPEQYPKSMFLAAIRESIGRIALPVLSQQELCDIISKQNISI